MNNKLMFSSKTDLWETPQDFFDALNAEFHFDLDACATAKNAKCNQFFSPEDDGLEQKWSGVVWCNPPYGKTVGKWCEKALSESRDGTTVVILLPARTDTRWFHDYIYGNAEIRFVKGRLKFGAAQNAAPFPSMVVIFGQKAAQMGAGGDITYD